MEKRIDGKRVDVHIISTVTIRGPDPTHVKTWQARPGQANTGPDVPLGLEFQKFENPKIRNWQTWGDFY